MRHPYSLLALVTAVACGGDDTRDTSDTRPDASDTSDTSVLEDSSETAADLGPDLGDDVPDTSPSDLPLDTAPDTTAPDATPTFTFVPLTVTGATPVWGAVAAGDLLLGGVDDDRTVVTQVASASLSGDTLTFTPLTSLLAARYCHCALRDPTRDELLLLGGRGRAFTDLTTATVLELETLTERPITGEATDFPVGCVAFFAPTRDRGWVFGGLSTSRRTFSPTTHRYDPTDGSLTPLSITGPPARYDASVHVLQDGDALLVGGMGLVGGAPTFYADVWRFSSALESWREVPASTPAPRGRRIPWTAVSPDERLLVFGYGSDSPTGSTVRDDLWLFDLESGTWTELAIEGPRPSARGFAPSLLVTAPSASSDLEGVVGLLGFGSDAQLRVTPDFWVLRASPPLGTWR